jgi:F-type H+-transporting ATPase subunit delta
MTERDAVVRGYAEAFLAVAEADGALDRVVEELLAFDAAVEQHAELQEALTDASLPAENRTAVVRDLLVERAHPTTVHLIGFAVEAGKAKELRAIVEAMGSLAAARRDAELAEVRSAVPLGETQRARIAQALSAATGRKVEVKVVVDPTLVGGVVARVGDEVFDGSVATRLDDAKQHLGSV